MLFMSYPYGNANEKQGADGTWTFTCQHGTGECYGNMWEDCAIEHYNTTGTYTKYIPDWFPFFLCMEKSGNAGSTSVAQKCATDNHLDWSVLTTCATTSNPGKGSNEDGNPLMHRTAVETNNLVPPHQWTPWVVINGKPLTSAQLDESLTKLVCDAYTGPKPSGCTKISSKIEKRE